MKEKQGMRTKIKKLRDTIKSSDDPITKSKAQTDLNKATKKLDKRINMGLFGLGTQDRIEKNREEFLAGDAPKNISDRMFGTGKKAGGKVMFSRGGGVATQGTKFSRNG